MNIYGWSDNQENSGNDRINKKIGVRGDNFARQATDTLRLFSRPGGVWGGGAPQLSSYGQDQGGGLGGRSPPSYPRTAVAFFVFRFFGDDKRHTLSAPHPL